MTHDSNHKLYFDSYIDNNMGSVVFSFACQTNCIILHVNDGHNNESLSLKGIFA